LRVPSVKFNSVETECAIIHSFEDIALPMQYCNLKAFPTQNGFEKLLWQSNFHDKKYHNRKLLVVNKKAVHSFNISFNELNMNSMLAVDWLFSN
jgi:hypothetical protein